MPALATPLPARRPELVIRPIGEEGGCIVKDPATGEYFQLGRAERFLLERLDGQIDADSIRVAYEEEFGQSLGEDDLQCFLEAVREQGLLQATGEVDARAATTSAARQWNLLHWRVNLWDPDRLFTRLAPRIWFFWTRTFLILSSACILLAAWLVWTNREHVSGSFLAALRWETAVVVWLTAFAVTLLHECAHGLTCKHYGGEVHEIGFLCLYFLPCFYCNVSDAWLFREKSKRLWVTFAGGYFELLLWALAVFVWRLTDSRATVNYLAFIVMTVSGVQVLFNFNPLLKLDGYYLLCDWREVPNLHQRGHDHFKSHLRHLLWGASRPQEEPRGQILARYGLASWVYSLVFLALVLWAMVHYFGTRWGFLGLAVVAVPSVLSIRGLFRGVLSGEVRTMIASRRKRTMIWLAILGAVVGCLFLPFEERSSGPFQLRSAVRTEVRAPVAGFVREVCHDEGDHVSVGAVLIRLDVPDLASRLAQKRADIRQSESRLQSLGEEVCDQRRRVARLERWHDLAKGDLARAERALVEELTRLDKQIEQAQAEAVAARGCLVRVKNAESRGVSAGEQVQEAERRCSAGEAVLAQVEAEKRAREARGSVEAKLELDRRSHELEEARAALTNLESATRRKMIDAEQARLDSLREEERYLLGLEDKLVVSSAVQGVITTPRVKEKIGQFIHEGELICVVEDPSSLEVEIALPEQEAARVRLGQEVGLKPRTLPFETITARVHRIAEAAEKGDGQGTVTVFCKIANAPPELRPGAAGYARVYTGQRPVGGILAERVARLIRTEFWW